ncbi:MAG TPA: tetratricopeptide repeat protein [Gemmatimonadales bacterium]|nr:tetratricopeptide repeat protein [Gemmatimonadales bacterium]
MVFAASPADGPADRLRALMRGGRFAEALAAFHVADEGARQRPDVALLAATSATRLGELAEARALAEDALAAFRARGDRDGRMRALNLLGVIGFEQGRVADAEAALVEALSLARELEDSQLAARASNNLASLEHLRGRGAEALVLYRSALLSYQRLGDRRGTAETYHNLGLVFRHLGSWQQAEDAEAEALRHAEVVGESSLLAIVVTGQAELRVERGDLALAEPELGRAARLAEEAGDELGIAEVGRLRARAALRRGEGERALREAEAAYALAGQHGAAVLRADCGAALALALRMLNRIEEAEARRAEVLEAYEVLGAAGLAERFRAEWANGLDG